MSPQEIVAREKRWAPFAAAGGIVAIACFVISQLIAGGVGQTVGGTAPETYRQIDANSGLAIGAGLVTGLALLALAPPLIYLFRAAQARSPRVAGGMIGLAFLGPILFAVQIITSSIGSVHIANEFVAQSPGVGDIYNLSSDLTDDSTLSQVAQYVGLPALLATVVSIVYTALWATRTGLLTRFTGTLGMALGASLIIGAGVAIPALAVWFSYLGFIYIDKTGAKPRPPAWDAGEAVAPPPPGERGRPATAAGPSDVVEGDATEIPGVGETNSNAARRERAKKRKRKRRR